MDRVEAARVLGVDPGASGRTVDRAFRRRARDSHPDRFPPGSEAWEDASYRMRRVVEARAVLTAPASPAADAEDWRRRAEDGGTWAWAHEAPTTRSPSGRPYGADDPFPSPRDVDRRVRAWGLGWGAFLVLAALVSYFVGATQPTNDALPFWSPALFVTGCVAIAIGLRAHGRLSRG